MGLIVPELRLEGLFATLPPLVSNGKNFQPIYDFGTQTQLYKFLNIKRKQVEFSGGNIYPIIWLETPFTVSGPSTRIDFRCNLVLATLTTSERMNRERLSTSFDNELHPLWENILTALQASGFTTIERVPNMNSQPNVKLSRHYNYGTANDEKHHTNDIWDALTVGFNLVMTDQCQRDINY